MASSPAVSPPSTPTQPLVLRASGLTWKIGGALIVSDVDLEVRQGEFLSIIGPNGAGKTSVLNLLSGVNQITAGTVHLHDQDVTGWRPAKRVQHGLGRTFQTSSLFQRLTVLENARLAAQAGMGGSLSLVKRPRRSDEATRKAEHALQEVRLDHRAFDTVADLSHGDQRKLEIALLLCTDPQVLLLDEPTAGVSVEDVDGLVGVIREVHARGRTVVMVEHRMELVLDLSDRIAVMHHGELLICDTPEVVMADPTVQSAYLGEEI